VVTSSGYTPAAGTGVTISAQLADQYGNAVTTSGISVTFTSTGGGTLGGTNPATTNATGVATITLTTGNTAGASYTVTATSTSPSTRTGTTPTITTVAGPAAKIAVSAGNGQSATVGALVATAPSVLVTDANNNPVAGVTVTFAVASGGGSVSGAIATTNASGIATVGSWTLGTTAGANSLTATSAGLTGSPVTFTATGLAGTATRYVVTSSGYTPAAGTGVTISAQLADQYGNAVKTSGIVVTWSKTGTGGSFATGTSTTNTNGIATVLFTTGTVAGVTYQVTGTDGSSRTGTTPAITTVAGAAKKISANAGSGQTAAAGTLVATAPSVLVTDANNNPVSGVTVTFAVYTGGGSVTGASTTTNASGIATVGSWTLGTTPGANSLRATSSGLTGSPVTFSATGVVGPAARYVVTSSGYTPIAGTGVTISAQLADQFGNAVKTSGIVVTWSKTGTGGSFATGTSTTNTNGIATVVFTTGTPAGISYVVSATDGSSRSGTAPSITTR
jgi:adhesin/invasin